MNDDWTLSEEELRKQTARAGVERAHKGGTVAKKEGTVTHINRKLAERVEKEKAKDAEAKEPEPVLVDGELPGMETEKIPELIRAGKSYNQAKKARMKMLETEVERKALVMSLMHQHELTRYKFGKLTIDLESTEKLKVSEEDDE